MRTNSWKPWTASEIELLRRLCTAQPQLTWAQILAHFPNRTLSGIRDKWKDIKPSGPGLVGRPRKAIVEDRYQFGDAEERLERKMIREGTRRLGEAIDAMLARQTQSMAA